MKIKLVHQFAKLPMRVNPTDAGADLFSPVNRLIKPHTCEFIDLGIQMELPPSTAGLIYARSGLGSKNGIRPRNCVGVIDAKYRGNVGIMLENHGDENFIVRTGDRIAQLVITPIFALPFEEVDELDMTDDRNGGFGSTGIR